MNRNQVLAVLAVLLAAPACQPVVASPAAVVTIGVPAAQPPVPEVARPTVAPLDLGAVTVDGIQLGVALGGVLDRDPYRPPCDGKPIDHRSAMLYFWSGGRCREAPPFPAQTTVVVVTRNGKDDPKRQPVELVVWAGGHWFDDKTALPVHVGDARSAALQVLGPPTKEEPERDLLEPGTDGIMPGVSTLSWNGRLHLLVREGTIVAVALGSLEGGDERRRVLSSTYGYHLKFTRESAPRATSPTP